MPFTLAVQFQETRQTRAFLQHDAISISSEENADWLLPDLRSEITIFREGEHYRLKSDSGEFLFDSQKIDLGESVELHHHSEFSLGDHQFRFELKQRDLQVKQKKGGLALIAKIMVASIFIIEFFVVFILPKKVTESQIFTRNVTLQKSTYLLDNLRKESSQYGIVYKESTPTMRSLVVMIKNDLDKQAWQIRRNADFLSFSEVDKVYGKLQRYQNIIKYLETHSFDQTKALKNEDVMTGLQSYYENNP